MACVNLNVFDAQNNMKQLPGPPFGGGGGGVRQLKQQVMASNFGAPTINLIAKHLTPLRVRLNGFEGVLNGGPNWATLYGQQIRKPSRQE